MKAHLKYGPITAGLLFAGHAWAQQPVKICLPGPAGGLGQSCWDVNSSNPLPITGSLSSVSAPFTPNGTISATGTISSTSTALALPAGPSVVIMNTGTVNAFAHLGTSSAVTAGSLDINIPAYSCVDLGTVNNGTTYTYAGLVTLGGTTTTQMVGGSGVLTSCSQAASGGGGGGSVNINQINGSAFAGTNLPVLAVPFAPNGTVAALSTVTATSAAFALPVNGGQVIFANEGNSPVYIHLGTGTTAATSADFLLNAGAVQGLGVINNGVTAVYANMISTGTAVVAMQGGAGTLNGGSSGVPSAQLTQETSIAANTSGLLPFGFVVGTSAGIRNTITMTGTTATTLLPAQAALHGYLTDVVCFRTDAGTITATVTLNDTGNTPLVLPPNGGSSRSLVVPLISTGTNVAITATPSTALTSVVCSANGYSGT